MSNSDEELASMLMILKGWDKNKALQRIRVAKASIGEKKNGFG